MSSIRGLPGWVIVNLPFLLLVVLLGYILYNVFNFLQRFRTPFRQLPGPPAAHWLLGNTLAIDANDDVEDGWIRQYGQTYATRVIFGNYRLNTLDPRVLSHILSHPEIYPKPEATREMLRSVIGEGLIVAERDAHRKQRRIMNPSFAPSQIRELTPLFFDVAHSLRDALNRFLDEPVRQVGASREVDVYSWVGRAALDIIGLAGFDYPFNSLQDDSNELFHAFHSMVLCLAGAPFQALMRHRFAWFEWLPTRANKVMREGLETVQRIGMQIVQEKKAAVQEEMRAVNSQGGAEKTTFKGRDLLSALIRANMATDLPEQQRMSDEEVLAQITTFLGAGHETTGSSVSWTLYSLAQHPAIQQKLRAELLLVPDDSPSMDQLNSLPYLDQVVKESLRYHTPVVWTVRTAAANDEIPLSRPVTDKLGNRLTTLRVQKGTLSASRTGL